MRGGKKIEKSSLVYHFLMRTKYKKTHINWRSSHNLVIITSEQKFMYAFFVFNFFLVVI